MSAHFYQIDLESIAKELKMSFFLLCQPPYCSPTRQQPLLFTFNLLITSAVLLLNSLPVTPLRVLSVSRTPNKAEVRFC